MLYFANSRGVTAFVNPNTAVIEESSIDWLVGVSLIQANNSLKERLKLQD